LAWMLMPVAGAHAQTDKVLVPADDPSGGATNQDASSTANAALAEDDSQGFLLGRRLFLGGRVVRLPGQPVGMDGQGSRGEQNQGEYRGAHAILLLHGAGTPVQKATSC